jgi:hypothetical protein
MKLSLLICLIFGQAFANIDKNTYLEAYQYADDEMRMSSQDAERFALKLMDHHRPAQMLEAHKNTFVFLDSSNGFNYSRSNSILMANSFFIYRRPLIKSKCLIDGFNYARGELNMFRSDAISFARRAVIPYHCEFSIESYTRAFNFAYNTANQFRTDSIRFADQFLAIDYPKQAINSIIAAYKFFYNEVNLFRTDSLRDSKLIGFSQRPLVSWKKYLDIFEFANSSRGLNYSKKRAHRYAISRIIN